MLLCHGIVIWGGNRWDTLQRLSPPLPIMAGKDDNVVGDNVFWNFSLFFQRLLQNSIKYIYTNTWLHLLFAYGWMWMLVKNYNVRSQKIIFTRYCSNVTFHFHFWYLFIRYFHFSHALVLFSLRIYYFSFLICYFSRFTFHMSNHCMHLWWNFFLAQKSQFNNRKAVTAVAQWRYGAFWARK